MTKTLTLPARADIANFDGRISTLKELQRNAKRAFSTAAKAFLEFAEGYHQLCLDVKDDPQVLREIDTALGIDDYQATRLRTIGSESALRMLKPIQTLLPPALESLYELARAPKSRLERARQKKEIHPSMTMRDSRTIRVGKSRTAVVSATAKTASREELSVELVFKTQEVAKQVIGRMLDDNPDIAAIRIGHNNLRDAIVQANQTFKERISK